jgi:hypothetical protein
MENFLWVPLAAGTRCLCPVWDKGISYKQQPKYPLSSCDCWQAVIGFSPEHSWLCPPSSPHPSGCKSCVLGFCTPEQHQGHATQFHGQKVISGGWRRREMIQDDWVWGSQSTRDGCGSRAGLKLILCSEVWGRQFSAKFLTHLITETASSWSRHLR